MKYFLLLSLPAFLCVAGCSLLGSPDESPPESAAKSVSALERWRESQRTYQERLGAGDLQGALQAASAMREIAVQQFEPADSNQNETLTSYKLLSQSHFRLGSYAEARKVLEEARPITLKLFGQKSIGVAALERNLALIASSEKDFTLAATHLQRSLGIQQRIFGLLGKDVFPDYLALATAHFSASNYRESSLRTAQGLAVLAHNGRPLERPLGQLLVLHARITNALGDKALAKTLLEAGVPLLNRPDKAPPQIVEDAGQACREVEGKSLEAVAARLSGEAPTFSSIEQTLVMAISLATGARIDPRDARQRELPALLETLGRILDRYGSELLLNGQQSGAHQLIARAAEFQKMAEELERGR